ncbi:hypothetical protein DRQ18_04840 [bacterium]|nr:MAG: hypothetical protein DRQ18_04840 [bacterium]
MNFVLFLLSLGCGGRVGKPEVSFIKAPQEGETLDVWIVPLGWEGNEHTIAYRLGVDGKWSEWMEKEEDTLYLGDGYHTVSLVGKNLMNEPSDTEKISFWVDAIKGPALWISPRYAVLTTDTVFRIKIKLQEVQEAVNLKILLSWNERVLAVDSISPLLENLVYLTSSNPGKLEIDAGLLEGTIEADTSLFLVSFNVLTPLPDTISLEESEIRNEENEEIPVSLYECIIGGGK